MIKGKYIYFDCDEAKDAFKIRKIVFGGTLLPDRDCVDDSAVHGVVYVNETVPIAAGRIAYTDGKYVISRIAVLPEIQRKRVGDFLVRLLADKAFNAGAKIIFADSPEDTVPFFESIGFKASGNKYIKNSVVFIPMSLRVDDMKMPCGHKYLSGYKKPDFIK